MATATKYNLPVGTFENLKSNLGRVARSPEGYQFQFQLGDNCAPDFSLDGVEFRFVAASWNKYPSGVDELLGWYFRNETGVELFIANE